VNAEETWTGANPRKLAAEVAKTFWRRLGAAVERGKAPSGAKKASKVPVAADAPEDNEEAPDSGAGAAAADDAPPAASSASSGDKPSRAAKTDTAAADSADATGTDKPKAEAAAADASDKREEPAASGGPVDNTAPRALDAWVGGRLFFRAFTFHQVAADTKNNVADYLPRALGDAAALVDWYPAAHATSGFASNLARGEPGAGVRDHVVDG